MSQNGLGKLKEKLKLQEIYFFKELNIFRRRAMLEKIVTEGFDAACQGYNTSFKICGKQNKSGNICNSNPTEELEEKKVSFWKDVCYFAKVGLEISTTVHGPDHSETSNWRKRNEDPVKYHKEENKAHPF